MNRVFDSTAINSTQRFANRMQSGIFPPQRKWCRLEPGTDIPEERKEEAQGALDIYTDKLFATLNICFTVLAILNIVFLLLVVC